MSVSIMFTLLRRLLPGVALLCFAGAGAQTKTIEQAGTSRLAQTTQVQGQILLSPESDTRLQQTGNRFNVEIWQVNYVKDKANNQNTDILLSRKLATATVTNSSNNTLQYTARFSSVSGSLIVLAYTGSSAGVKIIGRPNDGSPASLAHQFSTDARKIIGTNSTLGICSLPADNADFRVSLPSQHCNNCFGWDDVANAVNDVVTSVVDDAGAAASTIVQMTGDAFQLSGKLVQLVADGNPGPLPGVFIDGAKQIFYQGWETYLNLKAYGNSPKVRDLKIEELAWANDMIFHGSLQFGKWTIKVTNFLKNSENILQPSSDNSRFFTLQLWEANTIYVNMGDAFDHPMQYMGNNYYPTPGQVFIHELAHAWQIEKADNWGRANARAKAEGGSNYDLNCGGRVTDYFKVEQEATMVDRTYALLYFGKTEVNQCPFNRAWTEANPRNGQAFDPTLVIASGMKQFVLSNNLYNIAGGFNANLAAHSNGNANDGDGYFLPGLSNNFFVYYSSRGKTYLANWGPIRDKFSKAGYEFGELGWPLSSEKLLPDGKGYFQQFNHGYIYWSPAHGAYVVRGEIFKTWAGQNWEQGKLGYPIADYTRDPAAPQAVTNNTSFHEPKQYEGYQLFEGGVIFDDQVLGGVAGIHETTNIVYGDPNAIIRERHLVRTTPLTERQASQQQTGTGSNDPKSSELNKKAINPQPLPPKEQSIKNTRIH